MTNQEIILKAIQFERCMQDAKFGKVDKKMLPHMLPILIEEVGEVGTALQVSDIDNLSTELT